MFCTYMKIIVFLNTNSKSLPLYLSIWSANSPGVHIKSNFPPIWLSIWLVIALNNNQPRMIWYWKDQRSFDITFNQRKLWSPSNNQPKKFWYWKDAIKEALIDNWQSIVTIKRSFDSQISTIYWIRLQNGYNWKKLWFLRINQMRLVSG